MLDIIDIPNGRHGRRRSDAEINLVVLHAIGEWVVDYTNAGGKGQNYTWHCTDWLRAIGRSCHAFCLPDGRIVREVDSSYKAWHAKGYNTRAVGIEFALPGVWPYGKFIKAMEGEHPTAAYTEMQYQAGAEWVAARRHEHGIAATTQHSLIAPDVKFDPGVIFEIGRFTELVASHWERQAGGP